MHRWGNRESTATIMERLPEQQARELNNLYVRVARRARKRNYMRDRRAKARAAREYALAAGTRADGHLIKPVAW